MPVRTLHLATKLFQTRFVPARLPHWCCILCFATATVLFQRAFAAVVFCPLRPGWCHRYLLCPPRLPLPVHSHTLYTLPVADSYYTGSHYHCTHRPRLPDRHQLRYRYLLWLRLNTLLPRRAPTPRVHVAPPQPRALGHSGVYYTVAFLITRATPHHLAPPPPPAIVLCTAALVFVLPFLILACCLLASIAEQILTQLRLPTAPTP